MAEKQWYYEKLDENGKIRRAPQNDTDGKITGKHIINLPQWFDENPAERIRLGYIKHYFKTSKEIEEQYHPNHQMQFVMATARMIDANTCENEYHVIDKSEEQLLFEEMQSISDWWVDSDNGVRVIEFM